MLRRFFRSPMLCATLVLGACLGSCGPASGDVQPNADQSTPEIADAAAPKVPVIGAPVTLATFSQSKTWRADSFVGPWGVVEDGNADPAVPVPFVAAVPLCLSGFYVRARVPDVAGPHQMTAWLAEANTQAYSARFPILLATGKPNAQDGSDELVMGPGDALVFRNDADLFGGAVITARAQLLE